MGELLIAIALLVVYYAIVARWLPDEGDTGGLLWLAYRVLIELLIPAGIAIMIMLSVAGDPLARLPVLERAERLVEAGQPEAAVGHLERWLEDHPGHVLAHRQYLWAHFRTPL